MSFQFLNQVKNGEELKRGEIGVIKGWQSGTKPKSKSATMNMRLLPQVPDEFGVNVRIMWPIHQDDKKTQLLVKALKSCVTEVPQIIPASERV